MARSCAALNACVAVILCASAWADTTESRALANEYQASAAQPVLTRRNEFNRRLEPIMMQQARYLIGFLHPWDQDRDALLLTGGGSGEHDIRPNAHTVYGLVTLARCVREDYISGLTPELCREKAIAMLRFLLATHGVGGKICRDGKQWHNQWQSALWAYTAGKGAWLLWDDLDPHLKYLAARMICDEADRFVDVRPPFQINSDTKAEENAWNATVVVLAYNMFPKHPRHAKYGETAIIWNLGSFLRKDDVTSTVLVDGKPLRDWNLGADLHEDYTLENHDRVHPDYMNTISMPLFDNLCYEWGHNAAPQAISFNVANVYAQLKKLVLPDGSYVFPNGQDWGVHRNPQWIECNVAEAVLADDRQAATLMRISFDVLERMARRTPNAGVFLPSEFDFPSNQHFMLDMMSNAYLLLASRGPGPEPVPEDQLWRQLAGTYVFDSGKFAVIRSERSVATFSWGRRFMGMAIPLSRDLLWSPNEASMTGQIDLGGKPDGPRIRDVRVSNDAGVFTAVGLADRAAGAIQQRFAFVAFPDGPVLYLDRLKGDERTSTATLKLGMVPLLNEPEWVYHESAERVLRMSNGDTLRLPSKPDPKVKILQSISSSTYDIDGRLGIWCGWPVQRQFFVPNFKFVHGRLEQPLYLSYFTSADWQKGIDGPFTAGGTYVFLPGFDREQQKEFLRDVSMPKSTNTFHIQMPGWTGEIDLKEMRAKFEKR